VILGVLVEKSDIVGVHTIYCREIYNGSHEKISWCKNFVLWAFHKNLTCGTNMRSMDWCICSYTMMAGALTNFSLNSQTIVTIWHTFPTTVDAEWLAFSTLPFPAAIAWDDVNEPLGSGSLFLGCSHLKKAIFTISFTD